MQQKTETKHAYWMSLQDQARQAARGGKGAAGGGSGRGGPGAKISSGRANLGASRNSATAGGPTGGETGEGWARRDFLQFMGAGLALSAAGCFRRPAEKIVPYVNRPPDIIPGEPNFYASSFFDGMEGFSLIVKTREGRPVKIEGNPGENILNGRGLSSAAHGRLLSLYDPDRIRNPKKNLFNKEKTNREPLNISFQKADEAIAKELQKGQTALLTSRLPSPSARRLIKDFQKTFGAKHYVWDPVSLEGLEQAQKICYGKAAVPSFLLDRARFILSLNCDFLGTFLSPTEFQRRFAQSRRRPSKDRPSKDMSRLVSLESLMTLTGSNADERFSVRPSDCLAVLAALAFHIQQKGRLKAPAGLAKPLLKSFQPAWENLPVPQEKWKQWANELIEKKGLVLYGGNGPNLGGPNLGGPHRGGASAEAGAQTSATEGDPQTAAFILANLINSSTGADGSLVHYRRPGSGPFGRYADMQQLIQDLSGGQIKRLVIHGINPLYSFSEKDRLLSALRKADLVIYTGDRADETGIHSHYIIPDSHSLEKWGDYEFKEGVFSIGQPVIRPLYQTRSFEDSLITWMRKAEKNDLPDSYYQYIKTHWEKKKLWTRLLKEGTVIAEKRSGGPPRQIAKAAFRHIPAYKESGASLEQRREKTGAARTAGAGTAVAGAALAGTAAKGGVAGAAVAGAALAGGGGETKASEGATGSNGKFPDGTGGGAAAEDGGGGKPAYQLILYETAGLQRGDLANVSWLQEFPDPVTKICWGNYLCLSPKDALTENLKEGEIVRLSLAAGTKKPEEPLTVPVHIQPGQSDGTLALALGYGRSLCGEVGQNIGVNAWPLAALTEGGARRFSLEKTGRREALANVQEHHSMEGRDIVLETSLKNFLQNPSSGIPRSKHHSGSLWPEHKYTGHKWGMTIDLNACNGCGACTIACQSENNIPVVGKKYVLQGREMHWIRVDRYYRGEPSRPQAIHQPVTCMHCDNAPCETVCPVLATVHSKEGTNDMIYNRCVGTRYCANNCPYKVRRFNWFNYAKKAEEPLDRVLNPEVTQRGRGVMEKCTFCIQRVQTEKRKAVREGRPLKDGDIQTACQQSCPAEAISFGDLNDPDSKVNRSFSAPDSYALLDDMLNTKPSLRYLTKIRNKGKSGPGGESGGLLKNAGDKS